MEQKIRGLRWKEWKPGDPMTINRVVWDEFEIFQMVDVLNNDWFAAGVKVKEFEQQFAALTRHDHCQTLNSGSSALSLIVQALMDTGIWRPGSKILHPYLTFPTSLNPLILHGLRPVLVDVDRATYNMSAEAVEKALEIHTDIQGALIPHILGNSPNMGRIKDMLGGSRGAIVEDCCDTIGSMAGGRLVGTWGIAAAYSFYASHNVTTAGVGGAMVTDFQVLYKKVNSMAHWGRDNAALPSPTTFDRFRHRYWYSSLGHDMQMTEIQAAFGLAQLQRLPEMTAKRCRAFEILDRRLQKYAGKFILPVSHKENVPIWFGYPLTVPDENLYKSLVVYLIDNKVEIRPIFSGNIQKHPAYSVASNQDQILEGGPSPNADLVHRGGLFLPAWHDGQSDLIADIIDEFMKTPAP